MDAKEYNKIMERLDFIEFRQQLLFDNDDVSRSIFEYGLTREQYKRIMNLMQDYRERIERGEKCGHGEAAQTLQVFLSVQLFRGRISDDLPYLLYYI